MRYLPNNKMWFHWQALRKFQFYKKTIDKAKIFCPTLDRNVKNRFSISSEHFYPSGDVLAIIPEKEDPYFLTGYLNSDFFREYYLGIGGGEGIACLLLNDYLLEQKYLYFLKKKRIKFPRLFKRL